jgi:chitin disaccharide deacetylase
MHEHNTDQNGKMRRRLIVNADDFGLSPGVNRGIIESHECGIVTSASLMVRWSAAKEACDYARDRKDLSVGLHFDIYEWAYRDGEWLPLYEIVPIDNAEAIKQELTFQLDRFCDLMGRNPSHLDSHQHAHRCEPVKSILLEVAEELRIPLRQFCQTIRYDGNFYGQTGKGESYPGGINREHLIGLLKSLPSGVTELGCHPALDSGLNSMYDAERADEVKVLCDPLVKSTLTAEGIELITFFEVEDIGIDNFNMKTKKMT